jgi:hypothetical protein
MLRQDRIAEKRAFLWGMNLARLVTAASFAALAACSSSSASKSTPVDGGGDAGLTIDKAAADAGQAYCARVQACAPALLQAFYGDVATCATAFAGDVVRGYHGAGVTQTPDQVAACTAAIPQTSCADLLARKTPTACKPAPGTAADGAACAADVQCQGARCKVALGQTCGICGSPAAAGAACGIDNDCGDGLTCVASKCTAYGDEKAACDATHPCRIDLACNAGACGAGNPVGTACTAPDGCNAPQGIVCNPQSKKCDTLAAGGPNAPCGFVAGHVAQCTGGSLCLAISATTFQGTCSKAAAVGAACDTAAGPTCAPGSICGCASNVDGGCAGTCKQRDPAACH